MTTPLADARSARLDPPPKCEASAWRLIRASPRRGYGERDTTAEGGCEVRKGLLLFSGRESKSQRRGSKTAIGGRNHRHEQYDDVFGNAERHQTTSDVPSFMT